MSTTNTYATIRIWTQTLKKLRLLAALRDKRMVVMLDDLVDDALKQAQVEKQTWLESDKRRDSLESREVIDE